MSNTRIAFIGAGNMAASLIGGLRAKGLEAAHIRASDPGEETRAKVSAEHGIETFADNAQAIEGVDVVVLAVKPQAMKAVCEAIRPSLKPDQLVVSIAAGITCASMTAWLGEQPIVRCMPNTPALIGAGVTGLYADPSVDAAGREAAGRILGAVGSTVWAGAEAQMDAVTAISGSGPAYVFHFIEALESAGRSLGFDEAGVRRLAIDTVLGAAKLAADSEDAPAVLRQKVTSKGGTTEAALASLAAAGWHDALVAAVAAAEARGRELGEQLGKD